MNMLESYLFRKGYVKVRSLVRSNMRLVEDPAALTGEEMRTLFMGEAVPGVLFVRVDEYMNLEFVRIEEATD